MKNANKKKRSLMRRVPLCMLLTGMGGCATDAQFQFFWTKFKSWVDGSGKFVAEVKGTPVGAQTVVCVKGVNGLNVETNFVMWQLAGKTIEEYTNDIATELQKETRRKYIDSYKIQ